MFSSDFSLVHFPFSAGRPAIGDDEEEEDEQAESIAEHIYEETHPRLHHQCNQRVLTYIFRRNCFN